MLEAKDFADALNAAPDAILIVDSGGRIEFASERVSAIFGYAAGEIVDTCVDGLLPEPYRAAHAVQRATFARSEPRKHNRHAAANRLARR